jgi:hypothetical protein
MSNEFDLERAIAGEPIETVSGHQMEFIAYRPTAEAGKQVIVQDRTDILTYPVNGRYGGPDIHCPFDLRMKHVIHQIDWSNIPEDTVINTPEGDRHIAKCPKNSTLVLTYPEGKSSLTYGLRELEEHYKNKCYLVEQQPWTIWQGGDCPIPDGLEFEYLTHSYPGEIKVSEKSPDDYCWSLNTIYAYRPTGRVLEGWVL